MKTSAFEKPWKQLLAYKASKPLFATEPMQCDVFGQMIQNSTMRAALLLIFLYTLTKFGEREMKGTMPTPPATRRT